jgi:hypothetical protein
VAVNTLRLVERALVLCHFNCVAMHFYIPVKVSLTYSIDEAWKIDTTLTVQHVGRHSTHFPVFHTSKRGTCPGPSAVARVEAERPRVGKVMWISSLSTVYPLRFLMSCVFRNAVKQPEATEPKRTSLNIQPIGRAEQKRKLNVSHHDKFSIRRRGKPTDRHRYGRWTAMEERVQFSSRPDTNIGRPDTNIGRTVI